MQQEYDARDFAWWCTYERISPGFPERGDIHAALVSSTVANAFGGKGRKFGLKDFLLKFGVSPVENTVTGMKEKVALALRMSQLVKGK